MLLQRWVLVVGLMLGAGFLRAQGEGPRASTPEVRKQIVATIEGQLAAFRKHDVKKAYTYAAAALRAQKPLPLFTAIVQSNYPEIWANTRAEYGIVRDDGALATVLVHVFAKSGDAAYDFTLAKEGATWRVHDVLRHAPAPAEKI